MISEQISYEWEEIHQIRSRAVALVMLYRNRNYTLWLDEAHENNGKPFQCYGVSYRVRAVSHAVL
jgi:hypothetical protein